MICFEAELQLSVNFYGVAVDIIVVTNISVHNSKKPYIICFFFKEDKENPM